MKRPPVSRLAALGLLAASVLLTACAPRTRVVLLPDSTGQSTAVVVRNSDAEQVLDRAYATTQAKERGDMPTDVSDAATIEKEYGDVLRLTPAPAATYSLEFLTGGATLTPDSQAELETILTAAISRPGGEIVITGHTDTTGTPEANDRISQERANALRDLLIARGFPAARLQAVGRGQRELRVPTGLGVDEPRNRRVEITVR
jgi:outer membrane protein OmpA-like peptidoglycan-associated protein